jgi:hypothetical protein
MLSLSKKENWEVLKKEYASIYHDVYEMYRTLGIQENKLSNLAKKFEFQKMTNIVLKDKILRHKEALGVNTFPQKRLECRK